MHLALRRRTALLRDAYRELEPMVHVARAVAPPLAGATDPTLQAAYAVLVREAHAAPRIAAALRGLRLQDTGALYPVLEVLTSVELVSLCALEALVKRPGAGWERVAGALGDVEALVALAIDADERAPLAVPAIDAGPPHVEIEAGTHPLLDARRAVANDVALGGDVRLALVTGSNMAGKSTFLRMVAANVVLAQAGARVRARALRVTPLRVHAHIHVRDSLADGKSTFLVEVERVREVLDAAAASPDVLGILDELFRGTNSIERIAAGRAIAMHLAATGALFLVATHDPELAHLAAERVPGTAALHFGDAIEAGRMVFPYRVAPGLARTRNALRLLEIAGYPPAVVAAARQEAGGRGLDDIAAGGPVG
jgi:DNA mismatch repair ATPase MutS